MAYLSFDIDRGAGIAAAAPGAYLRPPASFTPTEWLVIRLARRDGLATLRPPSRAGAALRRLFGIAPANRLADPRLEALRQAAVRCWHGARTIEAADIERLLGQGFGFDQVALLAGHASPAVR